MYTLKLNSPATEIASGLRALALVFAMLATTAHASEERAGIIAINPSGSPTSGEVAFTSDLESPTAPLRIWIASADGTRLRRLTSSSSSVGDEEPAWSPDGSRIAFVSTVGSSANIWMAAPDGTRLTQLTSNGLNNHQPAWSPDGRKLAFVSDRGGSNDIWTINADGTGLTRLTKLPGQENHPSFSPDGSAVVFSYTLDGNANLMVVNADGSGLRSLTGTGSSDWYPSWGRAGIVFSSTRDNTLQDHKLWIVQGDGSGLKMLGNTYLVDPAWTSSGQILFTDEVTSGNKMSITLLNPATGTRQFVVNVGGFATGIDIRPGRTPNFIHPGSRGNVKVAILSRTSFDAVKNVDTTTLTFGRTGAEASLFRCKAKGQDVNRDGLPDLVCRFRLAMAGFMPGDTVGILRFKDLQGVPYEGRDAIVISKDDDDDDFGDD